MKSALYIGKVRHRRFLPVPHEFDYPLFFAYLDLDELPRVFRGRWLWSVDGFNVAAFHRRHHLGDPSRPLAEAVRDLVQERTGVRPTGPIRLLTHLSYFGYRFNPVSFYYIFNSTGRMVETIVAEINNTPWEEQYCYVLSEAENTTPGARRKRYRRFQKVFHVSPFLPMDMEYAWEFTDPAKTLAVQMENHRKGQKVFDATLTLRRSSLTPWNMARVLVQFPLLTLRVVIAIYWQAFRLWMKRVAFVDHPDSRPTG